MQDDGDRDNDVGQQRARIPEAMGDDISGLGAAAQYEKAGISELNELLALPGSVFQEKCKDLGYHLKSPCDRNFGAIKEVACSCKWR